MAAIFGAAFGVTPATSAAAGPSPHLALEISAMPSDISPTYGGNVVIRVSDSGGAATDGSPMTVTAELPAGVAIAGVEGQQVPVETANVVCGQAPRSVVCTFEAGLAQSNRGGLSIRIRVDAAEGRLGVLGSVHATVVGGGAPETQASSELTVASQPPPFGLSRTEFVTSEAAGAPASEAGGHPNLLTVGLELPSARNPFNGSNMPVADVKNVTVDLPPGLLVNPQAAAKCPEYDLAQNYGGIHCPTASVVGTVALSVENPGWAFSSPGEEDPTVSPLFNVVPEHGYPAEFAFDYASRAAFIYASVAHTSSGYVLRATVPAVSKTSGLKGVQLTFFGDPPLEDGQATQAAAMLTSPTNCSPAGLKAAITTSPWANPGNVVTAAPALNQSTACNRLHFEPTLAFAPQNTESDAPTGATITLHNPQNEDPNGLATPQVREAKITLPAGMGLSPPAANGLSGCPASGPEGIDLYEEGPVNTDEPEGPKHLLAGHCPSGSQIGTVKISTPLLESPLAGHLFLAQPKCGSDGQPTCSAADAVNGNLFSLYIEAEGSGVNIKLPGTLSANPGTGQLTASFKETPQLPFSDLELTITGGPRAPLTSPQACGQAQTTGDLTPWSTPETPDALTASAYTVDSNGAAGSCPTAQPFNPTFNAGASGVFADTFASFMLTFSRADRERDLSAIDVTLPPGILGMLSSVPLCDEPQASRGACSASSQIGITSVAAGAGPDPLWLQGQVYLTGPYRGAPFGLSVVVPADAGPFHLGNVVVRAALAVNPTNAAITVVSDELPQYKDGVPLRLKTITVMINRPGFGFNPTNCSQQSVTATIAGTQGATAAAATPFAVAGCANLRFKPVLTASTAGHASRASGASLDVKISAKGGPQAGGGEANIRSVKVDLPPQMPSRLSTLNKACLARVFEANPANCPKESDVGTASASTPVLTHPLAGPAYLVAHGGAAFPDLEIVLQGEGIVLVLDGKTDIKKGVTSSTFNTVPDAPISSFELKLPTGRFSILGSYLPTGTPYDFCGRALKMPTAITGQNGSVIHQTTKIAVTGCPKTKHTQKARRGRKASHRRTGGRDS